MTVPHSDVDQKLADSTPTAFAQTKGRCRQKNKSKTRGKIAVEEKPGSETDFFSTNEPKFNLVKVSAPSNSWEQGVEAT